MLEDKKVIILPLHSVKEQKTVSLAQRGGQVVTTALGNEGLNLKKWIQNRIDDGDIITSGGGGGGTDLSFLRTANDVTIYSSTGTDIQIFGAGSTLAGWMTASDKNNLTALIALGGVGNGISNLGTFTGSIISDNTNIKNALQQLETAVESFGASGNGIYGGSDNIPNGTVATQLGTFGIDTTGASGTTLQIGEITGTGAHYGLKITQHQVKLGNVLGSSLTQSQAFLELNSSGALLASNYTGTNYLNLFNAGGGELRIDGVFSINDFDNIGIRYAADYSANFVPLSLVTKQYVDGLISGSTDHNLLTDLQGGDTGEYYHLTNSQHDILTILNQGEILGRYSPGTGDVEVLTVDGSLTTNFTTQTIELVNDSVSPGNNKVYRTDGFGIKAWGDFPAGSGTVTSVAVTGSTNIDLTLTGTPTINPSITADLKTTGVSAGTYGNATNVGQFTVDNKGRLSSATNVPISITSASVAGLTESIQDTMSTTLVAGTNITITYNDPAGTITIDASGGSYTDEQAQDAVGSIMLNTSDVEFTYNDGWPKITAILADTGVVAGTYGSSSQVPVFVTDVKGRLYSVSNTPISITATQVSNFDEAVDDRVSNLLVAGSNVSLSYNDIAGTLTISSTGGGVGSGGYDTIKHDGSMLTQRTVVDFLGDAFVINDNSGATKTEISLAAILENLADIVTPSTGSMLYYNGTAWIKALPTRDVQAVSSGTTVTLPSTPKTGTIVDVYLNGVLQEDTVDYTISGVTLTFTNAFVSGNKVTTRYYS